jgi:hypothetical protein
LMMVGNLYPTIAVYKVRRHRVKERSRSMKPYVTLSILVISAIVGCLGLAVIASAQQKDAENAVVTHASLRAYPQAVISLKDPKTGMIFYVESHGRRLVAIAKDGAVAWSVDILAEAKIKPTRGQPVIRHLRLQDADLRVTCGRSDEAKVDIKTGKPEFVGAD